MNLRRRIYATAILGLPLLALIAALVVLVHPAFILVLLVLQFALGTYVTTRRCPQCRKAVLNNPVTFFGTKTFIWTVRVPERCTLCGTRLVPGAPQKEP